MSTTVISELHIQLGQEEAIVGIALRQLVLPPSSVAGRRFARLFQHFDDPTRLLYIAEWESSEACNAYAQTMPMPGTPDQYVQLPTLRYYRSLTSFERMLVPIGVASAVIVEGPADTHLTRRELGLAYHHIVVHQRRGLILLALYEAIAAPPGLLILAGWESMDAFQTAYDSEGPKLVDQLVAAGGVAQRFLGRVRAETPFG